MNPTDHVARIRRLLLARAERVVGGDLVGPSPLRIIVHGETLEARIDASGRLHIGAVVNDELHLPSRGGPPVSELSAADLDRLLARRVREAQRHRNALQEQPVQPTPEPTPEVDVNDDPDVVTATVRPPATDDRDGIIARLEALIGLAPVKRLIAGLAHVHDFDRQRARRGLPAVAPSPHLVFTGNPGTGKTTVARLVGELYKAVGVLPRGHVVEASRADMVAAYLGQTALKTRALCERALGGVLFIDEAYTLTQGHHDQYGEEAIGELLTFMENHRGEFAVIVAGYPGEMHQFLESNPGLRSRFDEVVAFPDYSDGELLEIFELHVQQSQFTLTPSARAKVVEAIAALPRGRSFANARSVRQLFNNVIARHARGLAQRTMRSDVMNVIDDWAVPAVMARPLDDEDGGRHGGGDQHHGYL